MQWKTTVIHVGDKKLSHSAMATDVSGPDSNVPLTNTLCQFSAMLSNRHYRVASNYDSETENGI